MNYLNSLSLSFLSRKQLSHGLGLGQGHCLSRPGERLDKCPADSPHVSAYPLEDLARFRLLITNVRESIIQVSPANWDPSALPYLTRLLPDLWVGFHFC